MRLALLLLVLAACSRASQSAHESPSADSELPSVFAEGQLGEPASALGMPGPPDLTDEEAETAFAEGAYGQPQEERSAQQALPQARDAVWRTLATTRIAEDAARGLYTATHTPEVRALAGRRVTFSGFIMPLETTPRFRHFLLTRYTPVCDFCPPGAPNEVVEVFSDAPIAQSYDMMRVTGRFSLTNDGEMGLFFQLQGAAVSRAS